MTSYAVHILSNIELENKIVWIIDDMIDTGGSIYKLVLELLKRKVKEVNIAVVHPVLSPPSIQRMNEFMKKGYIKHLLFTDTVYCCEKLIEPLTNVKIISSHKLAAEVIYRLNQELMLSLFFESFNTYDYLKK